MTIDDITTQHSFVTDEGYDPSQTTIIKVIGVGGGGGNAINHMFKQGIDSVSFVVCNTDRQALNNSPVPTKMLLGHTGLGAGNKPEVARAAAEESIEKIRSLFDEQTKMVFITAGMGGGTGTGAAPIVAREAKECGVLTVGIVTIPFLFEGERKIIKALEGADEMSKYVDALLIINNNRLIEIYADLDFDNAFDKADDTLSTAARSISELITTKEARINLDFNDVDSTLRDGGAAIISCGFGEGDNRVTKAIEGALNSPLLKNREIMDSKKLLFNLYYSRKAEQKFKTSEMEEFTKFVNNIDSGVDVIWGVAYDDTLGEQVKITILASGFKVASNEYRRAGEQDRGTTREEPATGLERVKEEYGEENIDKLQSEKDRARYVILTPEQMDDDAIIERLERTPAYNRDKRVTEEIKSASAAAGATPAPTPVSGNNNRPIALDFTQDV